MSGATYAAWQRLYILSRLRHGPIAMPLIDFPLAELHAYHGINPCPADFDKYWNGALAEMQALDPRMELRPAAFQTPGAKCFDLFFNGARGAAFRFMAQL